LRAKGKEPGSRNRLRKKQALCYNHGGQILELGHRFAFTMRISPFSQVITGIYKRAYEKDRKHFPKKHDRRKPR
jgi:hypothetical protein